MAGAVLFMLLWAIASAFPYQNATHPLQDVLNSFPLAIATRPFPTGAFWTNLLLGNEAVASLPYTIKVDTNQLQISYPFRVVTSDSIIEGFTAEIVLDVGTEHLTIQRYDELSVTVAFSKDNGNILLHLARGSPYITVEYKGATPVLSSALQIMSMTNDATNGLTEVVLGNWHKWLLFTSNPITWTANGSKYVGPTNYQGVLRFGLELSKVFRPILAQHAATYPVGATITHSMVNTDTVAWKFAWKTATFPGVSSPPDLLMTALSHHLDTFQSSMTTVPKLSYMAIHGPMTGVAGNTWSFQDTLQPVLWDYAPEGIMADSTTSEYASAVTAIKTSLVKDINLYPMFTTDAYNFGKQIAREARLVLIADRFKATTIRDKGLLKMKSQLQQWWNSEANNHFLYDTTFGGLVTKQGLADRDAEFGSGYYNDHHFHYGYFVYASAVLRKFDPDFVSQFAAAIDMIVSDIASPVSTSSYLSSVPQRSLFPTARHKDWFVGHSYASGLFSMSNGKSQESSSEAVNAYYAATLYSSLADNTDYYNYARLLLAMDIRSTQKYWQITEPSKIYEPVFAANKMVGVVSEMSVVYSTWFGNLPSEIHGINLMPITPITSTLLRPDYVWQQRQVLDSSSTPGPDFWPTLTLLDKAIVNASVAWQTLMSSNKPYDSGNSASNSLLFVASLPSYTPNTTAANKPAPKCFGYPACYLAGAFGAPLECCNSLPGCCPSDNACCTASVEPTIDSEACHGEPACAALGLGCCSSDSGCCDPAGVVLGCCKPKTQPSSGSSTSANVCHNQPACGALNLGCCSSPEGCCTPSATGVMLDCCNSSPPTTTSVVTSSTSATCYNEPLCLKDNLDCCSNPEGCCKPDANGGYLDCCKAFFDSLTAPPAVKKTCHNEPKCLAAGVDCCNLKEGCCSTEPLLGCCLAYSSSTEVKVGSGNTQTCFDNPKCLTAGPNASPLACCLDPNGPGCCPGAACCDGTSVEKIIAIVVAVLLGICIIYCAIMYYRRRHYEPVERDARSWYCAAFMLVTAAFFVYLMVTDMHFSIPKDD
ncbi:hypothetical protein THRCLA_03957 [Thraustotheca clavata]|uniref:glucan endo-1,3-beta-D-glucosidase n=1 Tax=Thraustotheca clavata TaxID=74557 RepID=A0A1W0A0G3_9STRA|nr:hypothetical protein THRCLA_03957 [Thraustotheca clavata]